MRFAFAFLLASLPLLAATPPAADSAILQHIPERMRDFVGQGMVAGAVTLVAQHDQILEFDATGMADLAAQRPMAKDTIFQVMSMTKPVTAIGIMMLAEEGKLALRDPVDRYLPEFHNLKVATTLGYNSENLSTPNHAITIRDLLTHTAGIRDPAAPGLPRYTQMMNIKLADVVREIARDPLLFQPGTQWSYSSPGIEILGRIIEVCSGQPYEDFIQQRILSPLGMQDSFFFPPAGKVDRIAMVYVKRDGKLVPAPDTILGGDPARHRAGAVFSAPGWGLYSTASDLLRLYRMMLAGGTLEGHRYLSPFSIHLMTEAHTTGINPVGWMRGSDYGLAWEVVTDPLGELAGHRQGSYGHGGAFGTQGWLDPNNSLISILLIQRADGGTTPMTNVFLNMAEAASAR